MVSNMKEKASAAVREQFGGAAQQRRTLLVSGVTVLALVVAGLTGWGIYQLQRPDPSTVPAHATANGDGIVVSSGPVQVDTYIDFLCPHCKDYEDITATTTDQLIQQNKIKMVYHPIAILDRSTHPAGYSTRAGAAAGCASDAGSFIDYVKALYAQQPAEGGAGLTDDELVRLGGEVGLIDPSFAQCVRDGRYKPWMTKTTDIAASKGFTGTPVILVAGHPLATPTGQALVQAVTAATN